MVSSLVGSLIIGKQLSLYTIIISGWIAGKLLHIKSESLASLLIYVIAPVVVFDGVVMVKLSASTLSLPLLFAILSSIICSFFYGIGSLVWKTSERNILAFAAGAGNVGYFGIPLVITLFGESYLGIAVLLTLGVIFFENSLGFFIIAKGKYNAKEALIKLAKLPALYAFFCGLLYNIFSFPISPLLSDLFSYFRGAYTILGMMLIGFGIAGINRISIDGIFTLLTFFARFVVWPIAAIATIFLDISFFHLWEQSDMYRVILTLSVVPAASNTVAFATQLNIHPEKSAITVLFSTFFALVYISVFIFFIFPLLKL